ncbi:MAG: hypothetical protein ABI068_12675 [Ktedonobacterales bacterium]
MRSLSRKLLASVAIVVLVLAGVATVAFSYSFAHAATRSNSAVSYNGSRGHMKLIGTVNVSKLPRASAALLGSKPAQHRPVKVTMRPQPKSSKTQPAIVGHAPSASGLKRLGAGSLLGNFDGINAIQNSAAAGGDLEPPDEGLAAGNGYVMNVVNLTGAIYTTNGTTVAGPFSLGTFFNESQTFNLSDPRAYYEASTHRWFVLIWEADFGGATESHIDLAVSTSSNPLSTYNIYRIDTTNSFDAGCPCFPDYTIFGIDQYNVYLSGNEFSLASSNFNGAEIYAVSKSQLEAGVTANYARFGSLSQAGAPAYHVQPAVSFGSPNAEYFMSSLDPNGTFDNRLGVWAMTNRQSVTSGSGMPNLSSTLITSEMYGMPPNATTPPGVCPCPALGGPLPTSGIVTNDFDAMQEVQYINGHLVGALDTAVTIPGDTSERSGVAWFHVTPVLSGNVIGGAHISAQGYVAMQGLYLLYPHINQDAHGNDGLVFSIGGPNTYLSAAYTVKLATLNYFGGVHVPGPGVDPDNGFTSTSSFGGVGRWGDYSAGEVNISNGTVWFATQYIPNNGDPYANWGNRLFEVQL